MILKLSQAFESYWLSIRVGPLIALGILIVAVVHQEIPAWVPIVYFCHASKDFLWLIRLGKAPLTEYEQAMQKAFEEQNEKAKALYPPPTQEEKKEASNETHDDS